MKRFIEGENRFQSALFPESLEDYIAEDNSIRIVDAFVDKLKLKELGFDRAEPSDTGRPGYLPATLLKIYIYGYLNRIQSSRRLERESYRNVELIWLNLIAAHEVTNAPGDRGQLASMAGQAKTALEAEALTVIADPGYYKGEEIVDCYATGIKALVPKTDSSHSKAKGRYSKADFHYDAQHNEYICPAGQRLTYRFDSVEKGKTQWVYMTYQCSSCRLQSQCTTSHAKRIKRWEQEDILDSADALLKQNPDAMRQRKQLVEHPFGTIKHWMGSMHFLMKGLPNVQVEMSLHVLAYNMKRVISVLGIVKIMEHLQAA